MKAATIWVLAVCLVGAVACTEDRNVGETSAPEASALETTDGAAVPVIFDTDIGGDIDDTWALAYLVRSPELDLKLVLTDFGDTVYRAKLAARLLEVAGRSDVPIGIGLRQSEDGGPQQAWVADYSLERYPGIVHQDGVQTMIDIIRAAKEPITLIAVGPAPNLKEALERAPDIAEKVRFVGMYGSVRMGYDGSAEPLAEWNVRADVEAVRAIMAAPWEKTLTPLDTCGLLKITGELYATVRDSNDALANAIVENYRLWLPNIDWEPESTDPDVASTTLYDIVAVYLAFAEDLVEIEEIGLRLTDEGMTIEDEAGQVARCALRWKNMGALEAQIVERLTSGSNP